MVPPPGTFFFFQIRLSGVSKRVASEHCQYSRDSKLAPVWSNLWKVSAEKIRCNVVNVHLYKFLKLNIQPFKTYFSMYEHLFAESHLQGFKTGQQWNTLLEQCQIWNSANALVKLFELWKCVGENYEEDKIEHKIMFTDVWILVFFFFQVIISFFSVAKPFLQGVEFSNPDLQAFETFFFRFELWQETDSIQLHHLSTCHYLCAINHSHRPIKK